MNLEKSSLISNLSKKTALVAFVVSIVVIIFVVYPRYINKKQQDQELKEESTINTVIQNNLKAIENKDSENFLKTVAPGTKEDIVLNPTYKAIFDEKTYEHSYSSVETKLIPKNNLSSEIRKSIKKIKDKYNFEDIAVVTLSGKRKTTSYVDDVQKTTESEISPLSYVIKQNGKWYVY